MNERSHIVVGIYTRRADADVVRERLIEQGLTDGQIAILEKEQASGDTKTAVDEQTLRAVGGDRVGFGVLKDAALLAATVSLFVASRLIRPLAKLGRQAVQGGRVGSARITDRPQERHEGRFSDLVRDALRSGHAVLVVDTRTAVEATLVRHVVGDSVMQRNWWARQGVRRRAVGRQLAFVPSAARLIPLRTRMPG